ncbi:MAG: SDR family oxidoreductase [Candidatus Krumholzibacteria bacterium]|nr:SDR family oxidoreductase [Candidatus Krumholzibacteria bacterium]
MLIDLKGKTVLVTGASSGIGRQIAIELGAAGAAVAVHYNLHEDEAIELAAETGNGSKAFKADLGIAQAAGDLFDTVVEEYGQVDVLVNNAGIFEPCPVESPKEEWLESWNRTLAVNLTSTGILCRAAINHFVEKGGGRIVNIASRAAFRGETRDYLAYAASKGGMVSLSRSIARSFGKKGVKSFVIAPGFVRTPMAEAVIDEEVVVRTELALGEMTTPGDIAPLVVLMASGKLDHATGSTVDINAGSYMR